MVSIAPFSTPACPDCSQNIEKTALFHDFAFLIFHPFFQGSADPICPYVWAPINVKQPRVSFKSMNLEIKQLYIVAYNLRRIGLYQ